MKTYSVVVELEVKSDKEEDIQQITEQYLLELIKDGSLEISYKQLGS